ncbi:MAG: hypothetical protein ABA06_00940 [Parcubacteria bacterium C7867-001]|nr:MAG: hypothetical protein ABA06_00940 [Parcubacteria bacterium C7867-001]
MNIEELSNTQLLLLTVLVNFVVAIATGVLTVSFLDQAPATVTQTVNQIVDHTIETVTQQVPGVATPTPSAEDQLTGAIAAAAARTVKVHQESTTTPALATGVYLPKSRAIATLMGKSLPKEVIVEFADGSSAPASLSRTNENIAIYGFSDSAKLYDAPAASPIPLTSLKAGQTIIALTSDDSVATGIISKISATGIYTSLSSPTPGTGAVNISGSLVGIGSATAGVFITADQIISLLSATSSPNQ